jgi:hypothetical protein
MIRYLKLHIGFEISLLVRKAKRKLVYSPAARKGRAGA